MTGKKQAKDLVYDYVHNGILSGEMKSGQFLEEKVISDAVGVSRTPVREAFHLLQNNRLISLLPRHGAQVRAITGHELMEVYESRRLIEGYAAQRICDEKYPLPPELRALQRQIEETTRTRDFVRRSIIDQEFHRTIVSTMRNNTLAELYASLQVRQQRVAVAAMLANPERAPRIDSEHDRLLDALERHDAVTARAVIDEHLRPYSDVLANLPL
ncbi:GntR family transcriptional regulator [Aureimonas populi]|uniref:GntR family transcriptional regulator n=1 Tax=Aureimonas populi TaxID=1701758 RepID=A0ABW5CNR2_9HYPH|nr:GntR family transcriptional regulator [Aureimonas populi]